MFDAEQKVPPVDPMSKKQIEAVAKNALDVLAPDHLRAPGALDLYGVVTEELPNFEIRVYPATGEELGPNEAVTLPKADGEVQVLVLEKIWNEWHEGGELAYRPRSTVAHELGHAILHISQIRKRADAEPDRSEEDQLLTRKRGELPAYRDPEWQAFMFAGAFLAPRTTLEETLEGQATPTIDELSEMYEISSKFMWNHLNRLDLTDRVRNT